MKRLIKGGLIAVIVVILMGLTAGNILAAPYQGKIFKFKQPDNTYVQAKVYGDEYYQRVESLDGYTLCYDAQGWICYAVLSDDGSKYVSSGVIYRGSTRQGTLKSVKGKQIPKRLRMGRKHIEERVRIKKQKMNPAAASGSSNATVKATSAVAPVALTGEVRGLALLINFPDETSSISKTEIENMLNQTGYSNYSNNGSVKDYFASVSGGKLNYTNYVTEFYTAKNPKSYYTNPNVAYAQRAMELVKEALQWLDAKGFDFSTLTTDANKNILAINCYYAGDPESQWGEGLWPHQGWVYPRYSVDGVYCYKYQMSDIGTNLSIGTTVHENGHLLCGWPDLYDYDGDSSGAGTYCVMSYTNDKNPVPPNPYYRWNAGWVGYTRLNDYASGAQITVNAGSLSAYRWDGSTSNEFFMIENIRKTGRWRYMPDEGLIIWHIDTKGDNSRNQMTASSHFLVSVEQADGLYQLEKNANGGGANDLFHYGWKDKFDNTTAPNSNWWNGSASGLKISNISAVGDTMSFTLGTGGSTSTTTPTPTATPTPTPTPTSNQVVWYKFDQSSGTTASDSSGNGKSATLINGPTWTSGKSGNAVNLDGSNDYLAMPAGIVSGLNDFTIATWVKLDTISTWSRIFDFGTGTSKNMFLTPRGGSNVLRFVITTGGYSSEQQINGTAALPTGVWKHVAITKSGNLAILYVDGVEAGRNSNMTINPSGLGNTNLNYIGKSQYADPYLDGQIDSFRIYNRALGATEIKNLFSAGI